MRDTRVFRVTYADDGVEFCNYRAVVQKWPGKYSRGKVVRIESTNAEATAGWTDVTAEFVSG